MKSVISIIIGIFLLSACASSPVCIHQAAKLGKIDAIEHFIKVEGINSRDDVHGHTALFVGCYYGETDVVKYLCEKGADLDIGSNKGITPLMATAMYNYPDITKILLDHGAQVDLLDQQGHSALYYATHNRYYDVADILKQYGAK